MEFNNRPLAHRMRPETLEEYIGQKHILGEGKLLRRAIEADTLQSLILYGPPSCGKTSLSYVISKITDAVFVQLNATEAKKSDIVDVISMAKKRMLGQSRKTILFIDEIHRFNKGQQDALLPAVEDGTVILIGATTENPHFEVNAALLSRSRIFQLQPLEHNDIENAIFAALESPKGLKDYHVNISQESVDHISNVANGDLRAAYNALELAVLTTPKNDAGEINITLEIAEESIQKRVVRYDKGGSEHYNIMSAFSKSLRGGDSTAALHYFARMIKAGEDPKAIVRRLITHSAEDVGLANPQALVVCTAAFQALEVIGMPEARLVIGEAIVFVAESPKSNSIYNAVNKAFDDIRDKELMPVPIHLRDTHYPGARELGNGEGYLYPHNVPGNWIPQQYAPDNIHGSNYYVPTSNGSELKIRKLRDERIKNYKKLKGEL